MQPNGNVMRVTRQSVQSLMHALTASDISGLGLFPSECANCRNNTMTIKHDNQTEEDIVKIITARSLVCCLRHALRHASCVCVGQVGQT